MGNWTREDFEYDPEGFLLWRVSRSSSVEVGQKAGSLDPRGYTRIYARGRQWYLHRLVYAYHTGEWPEYIDHIDRDKKNNRIENLRPTDKGLNTANCEKVIGKVPYRGVHFDRHGTYVGCYRKNRKSGFKTPEEAFEYVQSLRKLEGVELG